MDIKKAYFLFQMYDRIFGIPNEYVKKVILYQDITWVPGALPFVQGIFYYKGEIITLLDVAGYIALPSLIEEQQPLILLCAIEGEEVGFFVHSIQEVVWTDAYKTGQYSSQPSFSVTIHNQQIYLLDIAQIVHAIARGEYKEIKT